MVVFNAIRGKGADFRAVSVKIVCQLGMLKEGRHGTGLGRAQRYPRDLALVIVGEFFDGPRAVLIDVAIGAVNDIIQLPKRIACGFKNFQTAAACELAASYSSFQLLINSDHPQKTAKGLILLQI